MRQIVTNEIAHFLKQARVDQKISLVTLGKCIGKSSAYLSNIENGKIKTIKNEDLELFLNCIIGSEDSLRFFSANKTETISFLSRNSVNEKLATIFDYDLTIRETTIPKKLINYINLTLKMTKTTRELLYYEIEQFRNPPKNWEQEKAPPINKAICFENCITVMIVIDFDYLEGILDSKIQKTNYVVMASILLSLRIIMARNAGILNVENEEELTNDLVEEVHSTLYGFGFYSLVQITGVLRSDSEDNEQNAELVADRKTDELLNRINNYLRLYLESDADEKLRNLMNIVNNLQWDTSFWVKIATMPYYKLEKSSFTHKKNLINEMRGILDDYIQSPEETKNRDLY